MDMTRHGINSGEPHKIDEKLKLGGRHDTRITIAPNERYVKHKYIFFLSYKMFIAVFAYNDIILQFFNRNVAWLAFMLCIMFLT